MGPNNKKRSRKQYVKYRLSILKDMGVSFPPQEVIDRMYDESQMNEVQVDSIFLGLINNHVYD